MTAPTLPGAHRGDPGRDDSGRGDSGRGDPGRGDPGRGDLDGGPPVAPGPAVGRPLFADQPVVATRRSVVRRSAARRADPAPVEPMPATRPAAGIPHLPALDGLRGLAVIGVLCFHGGFGWAVGGYLGVSTFLTLSGFLITALLLAEHGHSGRVDLGAFWLRRARRLLPAALAAVALAELVVFAVGDPGQRAALGGDVLSSIGYVANWRYVLTGQAYGSLFSSPSPLLHFWSLAVEEQFYLVYPLLAYGLLSVAGWSRRRFAGVLAGLAGLSLALAVVVAPAAGWSIDRVYYGTDTRLLEVVAGALLAVWALPRLRAEPVAGLAVSRRASTVLAAAGVAGLAAMVAAWHLVDHATAGLYRGGLALYAGASVAVVVAAVLPGGPVRRLLGWAPLRAVGAVSYGLYLYHWPIFALLTPTRTHLDGVALFALRLAVTVPVALASYRWLELPFRRGRVAGNLDARRLVPFALGSLVLLAFVVSSTAPAPVNDFAAGQERLEALAATGAAATGSGAPGSSSSGSSVGDAPAGGVRPAPRLALFGDSTALVTGVGLGDVLAEQGSALPVGGHTELGCGIGRGGERRTGPSELTIPERCDWTQVWRDEVHRTQPDLVVVQAGPWDLKDRRLPGDDTWRAPGDPVYDTYLTNEMLAAVDTLSAEGGTVVWLTSPPVAERATASGQPEWREVPPPERSARVNELVRDLPRLRPGKVVVVDLAGWLAEHADEDERLRPDGVHLSDDAAREVARRYLAAAVLAAGGPRS